MALINERVGAIFSFEEKTVIFLGFGKYIDDKIPVEAVGFLADIARKNKLKNPCIELDNGTIVYGCECWWGEESEIQQHLKEYKKAGYTIVNVNINDLRQDYLADK